MATFFPLRSSCPFDTDGERKLAEHLDKKLNDRYLCWFNVPIGPKRLQPDFIVLHPGHGLLVLEVKDWKPDSLHSLTQNEAMLHTEDGLVRDKNPMEQARQYAMAAKELLEKDPFLQQTGSYAGNLIMPYSWGVVLPNITRAKFDALKLGQVLEPRTVLCKDEMSASTSEYFEDRLLGMFRQSFPCNLGQQQIDRIRYHLYPELRINPESGQFGLLDEEQAPTPSLIQVMDLQQEQLARSMGGGHRVIHGVAGSGKTMILVYRARYLASLTDKPVLVLCYNKTLASRLEHVLKKNTRENQIQVHHFHGWCSELLKEKDIKVGRCSSAAEFMQQSVVRTIKAVEEGELELERYGAILIDEAHDFEPEWFSIVLAMLEAKSSNLLVLYDDAQSIYKKKTDLGFTFSSVKIKAVGRTTILRTNYRNTAEILTAAKNCSLSTLPVSESKGEDYAPTLAPNSLGRNGEMPELHNFSSTESEWGYIAKRIARLIEQGQSPDSIGVLVLSTKSHHIDLPQHSLATYKVPFVIADEQKKRNLYQYSNQPSVKILTMHSSKGLEFDHVFIAGLNKFGEYKAFDDEQKARLLYVAMTRAIDTLVLTYHQNSPFIQQIQQAIQQSAH